MNPQDRVDHEKMSPRQWIAICMAIILNGLDGYDAASISFAAAGIASDWALEADTLGWVLSMELIGMAFGSILFGMFADRAGRKPAVLICLVLMIIGMFGAAYSQNVTQLSILRIGTGLGIGGMLSSLTALVSEYTNHRRRAVVMSTMIVGYPIGTVLGGMVARELLVVADWRAVFLFGGMATLFVFPLAISLMPESLAWLTRRRPRNAAAKINRILKLFGHKRIEQLPEPVSQSGKPTLMEIFRPDLARTTILLTLAYVGHMICYYFILKWMPKLVVDMGYKSESGADILILAMLAGAISGPIFGLIASRISLPWASMGAVTGAAISVNLFANAGGSWNQIVGAAILVGIFFNAGGVAFYALLAEAFPSELRGSGVGFGIGVGRAGAAFGPAAGGALFAAGFTLPSAALLIGFGPILSLFFIVLLFGLKQRKSSVYRERTL